MVWISTMRSIYKFLNINNHQAISDEVYKYIVDHTDALLCKNYFNDQPIHHMLSYCPLLVEFLDGRHLIPQRLATIVCANKDDVVMHKDSDGVNSYIRILWPIRNCQGSKTKIWKVPDGAGKLASDTNGILYTEFPKDQERELIDEFEKETKGNKRMELYTKLLHTTMKEVVGVQEEVGLDSLATPGGTVMMSNSISQEENLELISYLIIK